MNIVTTITLTVAYLVSLARQSFRYCCQSALSLTSRLRLNVPIFGDILAQALQN